MRNSKESSGLATAGAAADQRGAPAGQPSESDFVEPLNSSRRFGKGRLLITLRGFQLYAHKRVKENYIEWRGQVKPKRDSVTIRILVLGRKP